METGRTGFENVVIYVSSNGKASGSHSSGKPVACSFHKNGKGVNVNLNSD